MNMLSIFHTGGVTLMLTLFWLGLGGWFGYQTYKAHNSEYGFYNPEPPGQWIRLADKTPVFKIWQFWGIVILTVLYIICLFIVASDYRGV